jgi:pimeloyl-ACP methyl ester carboxylesterase
MNGDDWMAHLTVNGIPTHVTIRGEGKNTIFLVHGAGGSGQHFMLAEPPDGWRLVAVDLPGHGKSGGDAQQDIKVYADWVAQCIRETGGCDILAGHSMGGAIAMTVAQKNPASMRGLILISTGARLSVSQGILDLAQQGVIAHIEALLAKFAFGPLPSLEQIRTWYEIFGASSGHAYFRDFSACNQFDIRDQLVSIQLPALVVCGMEDRMTPFKYSEFLASGIPGATLQGIPEAGHMVMLEQPELFNAAVAAFCSRFS